MKSASPAVLLLLCACATAPSAPPRPTCSDQAPTLCAAEGDDAYRKEDFNRARALYTTGCARHDGSACVGRGHMEANGLGGPHDHVRAKAAFVRACDLGNTAGCIRGGELAQWGVGAARNEAEARSRFARACEQGSVDGCRRTAELEQMGRGGSRDLDAAIGRFTALCARYREQRDCDAADAAKQLKERMTAPQSPPSMDGCGGANTGGLEKKVIAEVMQSHRQEVRYCYELELSAGKDMEGKVVMQFAIGELGSVKSAEPQYSNDALAWTARCVAEQVRSWRFPAPRCGGQVTVNYPFLFKMGDKPAGR